MKRENNRHQADLLFLPDDKGYRYLLMVVDMATKRVAGRPLKNKKAANVLKGLAGASVFVGPRLDDLGACNLLHGLPQLYILSVSCVL